MPGRSKPGGRRVDDALVYVMLQRARQPLGGQAFLSIRKAFTGVTPDRATTHGNDAPDHPDGAR